MPTPLNAPIAQDVEFPLVPDSMKIRAQINFISRVMQFRRRAENSVKDVCLSDLSTEMEPWTMLTQRTNSVPFIKRVAVFSEHQNRLIEPVRENLLYIIPVNFS